MAINSVLQSLKLLNPLFFSSSRIPFYNCLRENDFLGNPAVRLFHDCSHSKDQEQRLMNQTLEEKHSMECELEVVKYLDSLKNYEKVGVPEGAGTDSDKGFDLQRMHRLLARLGDPLSKFQVVHVAGTKGKGSTVAFISNILRAAGFSVGTYTSPHISSIRERIVAGKTGRPISAEALRDLLRAARGILDCAILKESGRLSHFEVLTALAFKHFAEEKVDFAVVEAGLGGARDATNVVQPNGLAAAVIVAIGEEHLEALGGSLESIALAKAGIIKYGCPVVLGHQSEPIAEAVVQKVAASKRAHVFTTSSKDVQSSLNGYYIEKGMPFQMCSFVIDSKIEGL
ncbi:hypothetical protein O6H91_12G051700 [Diphasiastrum complanatum]|nr:hypothetical protein O6H91_12G051700 [Diphasiastrum complanatum]